MKRFTLKKTGDPTYPIGIWDNDKSEWRGRYYASSLWTARCHRDTLNRKAKNAEPWTPQEILDREG